MTLRDLTDSQLERLYGRLYDRLADGMGYQPYGMDRPTMLLVKPACMRAIDAVVAEARRRRAA